ncbi:hypothetical protein [Methylococcus geothermalis]|uniref:Uncharacterized protein n=1 Tax=Methylococcus geothermalis TaxID=2681310 RepID=A0A858Q8Z0_9GAMM|nr:hypothetical protein [Methylococcus geothermalis]QJD30293.1 hypothetical protein GNH96_10145 [Methylococcus geothermalis]
MIDKRKLIRYGLPIIFLISAVFAGELMLEGLIEFADLLLELSQHALITFYSKVFGLDHLEAQHKAAWTSMITFIIVLILTIRKLAPKVALKIEEGKAWYRDRRDALRAWWRSLGWLKKTAYLSGGLAVLAGLAMIL